LCTKAYGGQAGTAGGVSSRHSSLCIYVSFFIREPLHRCIVGVVAMVPCIHAVVFGNRGQGLPTVVTIVVTVVDSNILWACVAPTRAVEPQLAGASSCWTTRASIFLHLIRIRPARRGRLSGLTYVLGLPSAACSALAFSHCVLSFLLFPPTAQFACWHSVFLAGFRGRCYGSLYSRCCLWQPRAGPSHRCYHCGDRG
jgi:hypothetical protein